MLNIFGTTQNSNSGKCTWCYCRNSWIYDTGDCDEQTIFDSLKEWLLIWMRWKWHSIIFIASGFPDHFLVLGLFFISIFVLIANQMMFQCRVWQENSLMKDNYKFNIKEEIYLPGIYSLRPPHNKHRFANRNH